MKPTATGDSPDKAGSRRRRESAPSPSKKTQATSSELAGPTPANEESGETRQPGKTDSSSRDWASLIKSMRLKGVSRQVAVNCQMLGREGNVVSLQLDPASKALITDTLKANLQKSMSEYFKTDISLRIVLAEPAVETPAKQVARQEQERLQQARESLEQDPNIQALKSTFGAAILEDTIRPLDD